MRFLIYGVFLAGWMAMWIWNYTCHIKMACCPGRFAYELPAGDTTPGLRVPIAFVAFGSEPLTGEQFAFYRDSIMAQLDLGKVLQITGFFTEAEGQSIGADRAVAVLEIMASQLEEHRYTLRSRKAEAGTLITDKGEYLVACDIEILSRRGGMDSIASRESDLDF